MTFSQHLILDPNDIREVNAQQMAQRMEQLISELRPEIKRAQALQFEMANKSRRVGTEKQVGDKVSMDARNLSTARLSKKLDWKRIGPYDITEVVSPWAYGTQLPNQLRIHNVQPISRLEKAAKDPLPNQKQEPPPLVMVDIEEDHQDERIDDSRLFPR
jgi:hypothetical protein